VLDYTKRVNDANLPTLVHQLSYNTHSDLDFPSDLFFGVHLLKLLTFTTVNMKFYSGYMVTVLSAEIASGYIISNPSSRQTKTRIYGEATATTSGVARNPNFAKLIGGMCLWSVDPLLNSTHHLFPKSDSLYINS